VNCLIYGTRCVLSRKYYKVRDTVSIVFLSVCVLLRNASCEYNQIIQVNLLVASQVRSTIRSRWNRWQEGRSISTRYTRDTRGSMATTNGEMTGLRMSFRGINGISNGPSEIITKTITRNNNHEDATEGILIHNAPDEEAGRPEDSDEESLDQSQSIHSSSREITLLHAQSTSSITHI
jgi:hypothetical protein